MNRTLIFVMRCLLMGMFGFGLLTGMVWAGEASPQPAGTPVAVTTLAADQAPADANIPVLCYHRFGKYGAKDIYSLDLEDFKRQLQIIQEEGFTPITASQLLAGWRGKASLPEKPLLITIDDGYKDFRYQAEGLLQKFKYPATLFVYPIFVGSKLGLPKTALAELQKEGFEIGSHSMTHPKLTHRPANETVEERQKRLEQELKTSREQLRAWSGGEVEALAYPYGLWDQDVAASAQAAGYQLLFTVNPGVNTSKTPRFALKRILILRGMRESTFRQVLKHKELPVTAWNPQLGVRAEGPLSQITVTIDPGFMGELDPASLHAKKGEENLALKYNAQTGEVLMNFPQPWHHGTNLLQLSAHGLKDKSTYLQSWLLIVDPAHSVKGK